MCEKLPREEPQEPCKDCLLAEWVNMFGKLVWCCATEPCVVADYDVW